MSFGQNPAAGFFLNEIAALSDGCLVIEAAFKAGSVITASQAADKIVPVMAIQTPLLTAALEDATSLSQAGLSRSVCLRNYLNFIIAYN